MCSIYIYKSKVCLVDCWWINPLFLFIPWADPNQRGSRAQSVGPHSGAGESWEILVGNGKFPAHRGLKLAVLALPRLITGAICLIIYTYTWLYRHHCDVIVNPYKSWSVRASISTWPCFRSRSIYLMAWRGVGTKNTRESCSNMFERDV